MTGYQAQFEPAMRVALSEAGAAGEDVPVGAVVVDGDGTIIGRGRNQRETLADPVGHAEIAAIRAAGEQRRSWRLDDCTLVVTLEPCTMCAGALLAARMPRLVYGAADPRAGAAGSVWDVLHDPRLGPPVEVLGGILADECAALLREFFEVRRPGGTQ
jgi:tRNA(adenine34) deaminase